jgi:hypothetical protein
MYRLTVSLAANPRGSDPLTNLYALIKAQYPSLGLTRANSQVTKLQGFRNSLNPNRAYLRIVRNGQPNQFYEFTYDRFDIAQYLRNPFFTAAELTQIAAFTNDQQVLAFLATKANLNFTPEDFWVEGTSRTYAGGSTKPNWLVKTQYDSIFWLGEFNLHLHL